MGNANRKEDLLPMSRKQAVATSRYTGTRRYAKQKMVAMTIPRSHCDSLILVLLFTPTIVQ